MHIIFTKGNSKVEDKVSDSRRGLQNVLENIRAHAGSTLKLAQTLHTLLRDYLIHMVLGIPDYQHIPFEQDGMHINIKVGSYLLYVMTTSKRQH